MRESTAINAPTSRKSCSGAWIERPSMLLIRSVVILPPPHVYREQQLTARLPPPPPLPPPSSFRTNRVPVSAPRLVFWGHLWRDMLCMFVSQLRYVEYERRKLPPALMMESSDYTYEVRQGSTNQGSKSVKRGIRSRAWCGFSDVLLQQERKTSAASFVLSFFCRPKQVDGLTPTPTPIPTRAGQGCPPSRTNM